MYLPAKNNNYRTLVDIVLLLRGNACDLKTRYEDDVYNPFSEKMLALESKGVSSVEQLSTAKRIVEMDRAFLMRYALDGPQTATYFPNPYYLYSWTELTCSIALSVVRKYMNNYNESVSKTLLRQFDELKVELFESAQSATTHPGQGDIGIELVEKLEVICHARSFFDRRLSSEGNYKVFFHGF